MPEAGLSLGDRAFKRALDVGLATLGLLATAWLIALLWLVTTLVTRRNGFFLQERIGRHGKPFSIVKLRTMRDSAVNPSHVTTTRDPRITRWGRFLRRAKLDELPQLLNVLVGHMSLVGPRPDVRGFADRLVGDDSIVLSVRPGVTGPASLRFRDEERLLADQEDPERFNREVLYPEKVRINRAYVENYRPANDLRYLWRTLVGGRRSAGGQPVPPALD
jgi:lipopolysaccharide/colanic/teichoic acid biosynthesis glycosyltransferase